MPPMEPWIASAAVGQTQRADPTLVTSSQTTHSHLWNCGLKHQSSIHTKLRRLDKNSEPGTISTFPFLS